MSKSMEEGGWACCRGVLHAYSKIMLILITRMITLINKKLTIQKT